MVTQKRRNLPKTLHDLAANQGTDEEPLKDLFDMTNNKQKT